MSGGDGIPMSFRVDLTTARTGKLLKVTGKHIRIADASSANAIISIAVKDNTPDRYEQLKKNGRIRADEGFSEIYLKNDAQASEWVRVIVSNGLYDVDNPSASIVDEIASPVTIDEIQTAVDIAPATTLDSKADVSLVATATTLIAAANPLRKRIRIGNKASNTQTFRIGDSGAGAANGDELPPAASWENATTDAVYGYNPGGSAESVTVSEDL